MLLSLVIGDSVHFSASSPVSTEDQLIKKLDMTGKRSFSPTDLLVEFFM